MWLKGMSLAANISSGSTMEEVMSRLRMSFATALPLLASSESGVGGVSSKTLKALHKHEREVLERRHAIPEYRNPRATKTRQTLLRRMREVSDNLHR